jgi:hypothetical protein
MNASMLLADLQSFLERRGVALDALSAEAALLAMADWYRFTRTGDSGADDVLVFRHAGWSEGCATGFKLSVLRRVTARVPGQPETDWLAGITILHDPARFADLGSFSTDSGQWPGLEAFVRAVQTSAAYRRSMAGTSMGVVLEGGGLR